MTTHCYFDLYSFRDDASAIRDLPGKDSAHLEEDRNQRMKFYHDNRIQRIMEHKLMLTWIRKVLVQHTKGRHALLVFDTFKGHLTNDVLANLAKDNIFACSNPRCLHKQDPAS